MKEYTPDRGDIVYIQFNPQAGREQSGRRPALVLSPKEYNEKSGLALMCPITNQQKGYPFEVPVQGKRISGVVLSDHLKSIDYSARQSDFAEKISEESLSNVIDKVQLLIV